MKLEAPPAEVVRLAVPTQFECVRIIRLTASTVAARLGFDFEDVEDLRIAVDELANLLLVRAAPGQLEIEFRMTPDGLLHVSGRVPANGRIDLDIDELTEQVLRAVIDGYELKRQDGHISFACTAPRHLF